MPERKQKTVKERVEELAAVLEEGVKNFQYTPEELKALLEMKALMPTYSFRNILVAKAQFPYATFLASLKRWNELGRKVKKGSKAIRIFAPRFKKIEDEETGEEKQVLIGFITVPVFALEQTEGEPLPIDRIKINLEGDSPEARRIIRIAEMIAGRDGCRVTYRDAMGANGYYQPATHEIVVDESLSMNQRCKTLVHELVHSKVHRQHTRSSTAEKEIVAEGTAFIVCSYFGLDTSDYSFRYVYSWKDRKDENPLMTYGTQICEIAQKIIEEFQTLMEYTEETEKKQLRGA
jgi:antirestriction protein ArdC